MANDAYTLPWRVTRLETTVDKHDDAIGELQQSDATLVEKVSGLTTSTDALKGTMDKVYWVLISLCITIIGATVTALLVLA